MTTFRMSYARRFRTGPYETAEIMIEDTFDKKTNSYMDAEGTLQTYVDVIVDSCKENYARESAAHPERKR